MREGIIHKVDGPDDETLSASFSEMEREDTRNAKHKRRKKIIIIGIVAIIILIINLLAIFGGGIFNRSKDPIEEDVGFSVSDTKHKIAVLFIDGHMVEYEYSWSIAYTSNGTVNIKLTDGTEIETFIGNVYLFEYDGEECTALNDLRNKFM